MAGAADQATSSDKGAKAMDYQNAKQLIGLLQSRQVSAVELTDRAIARIEAHDGKVQMIDSSVVRVHQQAAAQKNSLETLVSVEVVED